MKLFKTKFDINKVKCECGGVHKPRRNYRYHGWYDLTKGKGEKRNYIAYCCYSHYFDGKFYTCEEWEKWVNEDID